MLKFFKQFILMSAVVLCASLATMAQKQDDKKTPKPKPPVVVVGDKDKPKESDRPKDDNRGNDNRGNDNRGKRPGEED